MSETTNRAQLSAFSGGEVAVVRIVGPGTCKDSGRFENLLLEVEKRGFPVLALDVADCPRMDSTFAGAFLRLAGRIGNRAGEGAKRRVVLAGVRDQVAELLDTLCVRDFFETVDLPSLSALTPLNIEDRDMPKEKVIELSLEGHELLSQLNAENERRFRALLQVLREQLRPGSNGAPSGGCP